VREHVDDPGRFLVPVDVKLLDTGVGGDHHLAAYRHHRAVGHQVAGADAGAVDDDRSHAGQSGQ
jgi:hypothetical protein